MELMVTLTLTFIRSLSMVMTLSHRMLLLSKAKVIRVSKAISDIVLTGHQGWVQEQLRSKTGSSNRRIFLLRI